MNYYNQNDYGHVPYPSVSLPAATVKSGGCGVCCGSTVLSAMGVEYPPPKLASIYIIEGARVSGGTDMSRAAQIICKLGQLTYSTTSSEDVLIQHLKSGGVAIANVDGDVGEKGIFSSAGHYIVVLGVSPDGRLIIFDVGDYPSKYLSSYRATKVKRDGKFLLCTPEVLNTDTLHRDPSYYLFKKEEKQMQKTLDNTPDAYAKDAVNWALGAGILKGDANGDLKLHESVTRQDVLVFMKRLHENKQK